MDNQQESSITQKDFGWLGGIIDGEGTITLVLKERKNQSPLITPKLTIVNTDKKIIDKILEIYKHLNIPHWITEYKGTKNWKKRYVIEVVGISRILRTLPILINYLVGKKELADLVLNWCNRRYNSTYNKHRRIYYDEKDIEIYYKVKSLHGHQDKINKDRIRKVLLKSSETICQTQKK